MTWIRSYSKSITFFFPPIIGNIKLALDHCRSPQGPQLFSIMTQRKGKAKAKANIILSQDTQAGSEGEVFDLNVSDTSSVASDNPPKAPTSKAPTTAHGGRAATTAAPVAQQLPVKGKLRIVLSLVSSD